MQENTDQKLLRIWTLFTQWKYKKQTFFLLVEVFVDPKDLKRILTELFRFPFSKGGRNAKTCKYKFRNNYVRNSRSGTKVKLLKYFSKTLHASFAKYLLMWAFNSAEIRNFLTEFFKKIHLTSNALPNIFEFCFLL